MLHGLGECAAACRQLTLQPCCAVVSASHRKTRRWQPSSHGQGFEGCSRRVQLAAAAGGQRVQLQLQDLVSTASAPAQAASGGLKTVRRYTAHLSHGAAHVLDV